MMRPNACPFCRQPPTILPWHAGRRMISCENLNCWVQPSVSGETEGDAIF